MTESDEHELVKKWQWFASECSRAINAKTPSHVFARRDETLDECADELETWLAVNLPRIKVEARLEEAKLWREHSVWEGSVEWADKRIAELSAQTKQ